MFMIDDSELGHHPARLLYIFPSASSWTARGGTRNAWEMCQWNVMEPSTEGIATLPGGFHPWRAGWAMSECTLLFDLSLKSVWMNFSWGNIVVCMCVAYYATICLVLIRISMRYIVLIWFGLVHYFNLSIISGFGLSMFCLPWCVVSLLPYWFSHFSLSFVSFALPLHSGVRGWLYIQDYTFIHCFLVMPLLKCHGYQE